MTLLDLARGPLLQWSLIIFVVGVTWRLAGIYLLYRSADRSTPRRRGALKGGVQAIVLRSVPPHELERKIVFAHVTGYAWHIGFFVTVLLFGAHMPFFESILGFGWPALPNTVIEVVGAITLAILIALLVRRMLHPVLKVISTVDDYVSVIVCTLPLATGFLSYSHVSIGLGYETMLALHIISVELLLVWFPVGKLMHLFLSLPTRFQAGAAMQRKGVEPS